MTDARPRYTYILPDGREVAIVHDHGETPKRESTFTISGVHVVPMWLRLDADTITDKDIEALRNEVAPPSNPRPRYRCSPEHINIINNCDYALTPYPEYAAKRDAARARVAEIINARRAQVKP